MAVVELEDFQCALQHMAHRQSLWRTHMWRMKLSISVKAERHCRGIQMWRRELEGLSWCSDGQIWKLWCHPTPVANVLLASSFLSLVTYCSMIDAKQKVFHVHVCLKKWQKGISEVHRLFPRCMCRHTPAVPWLWGTVKHTLSFAQLWINA